MEGRKEGGNEIIIGLHEDRCPPGRIAKVSKLLVHEVRKILGEKDKNKSQYLVSSWDDM